MMKGLYNGKDTSQHRRNGRTHRVGDQGMNVKPENLTRALAILTTEVDEGDVRFEAGYVIIRQQRLHPQVDDDCEVLSVLIANPEFGFAVSAIESMAKELRELQKIWLNAADELKLHEARLEDARLWRAAA